MVNMRFYLMNTIPDKSSLAKVYFYTTVFIKSLLDGGKLNEKVKKQVQIIYSLFYPNSKLYFIYQTQIVFLAGILPLFLTEDFEI